MERVGSPGDTLLETPSTRVGHRLDTPDAERVMNTGDVICDIGLSLCAPTDTLPRTTSAPEAMAPTPFRSQSPRGPYAPG
jgi:hypothetical protein